MKLQTKQCSISFFVFVKIGIFPDLIPGKIGVFFGNADFKEAWNTPKFMGPTRPLFIITNNIDMLKLFVIIINKFIVMTRNCNMAEIFVVIIDWIIIVANICKHAYYYS